MTQTDFFSRLQRSTPHQKIQGPCKSSKEGRKYLIQGDITHVWMKIHPIIHASTLNPYHQDPDDNDCNNIVRLIINLKQKDGKEVEEIENRTQKHKKPTKTIHEFLIK